MGHQEREHLIRKIEQVFKLGDPPDKIVYDTSWSDAMIFDRTLRGKKRTEIPLEDIIYCRGDLFFFSAEGLHYYLPGFLIPALRYPHETDTLIDVLISVLGDQTSSEQAYALFTEEERVIVREFLSTYLDLFDEDYWDHDKHELAQLDMAIKRWNSSM